MRGKPRRSHVEIRPPFRRSARAAAGRLASVAAATLLLVAAAPAPAPQSKEEVDRQLIEKAIEAVRDIRLHIDEATPYEVARGIFAFGPKFKVYPKDSDAYVLAVEYLLTDECWKKKRIFDEKDGEVRLRPLGDGKKKRIITEQLPHELLMMLGVAGVPLEAKVIAENEEELTLEDVIETAKKDVDPSQELSCSLVTFASYLDWKDEWEVGTRKKKKITQEKLLQAALQKNPAEHAEEGAFHLFALCRVREKARKAGGLPEKVDRFISDRLTQRRVRLKAQQSSVGSLGFLGVKGLETTARDLNWILISGDWEEIHQPWVDRAAVWLAKELEKATKRENVTYDTLALGARALQEYQRLRYPAPEGGPGAGGGAGPGRIAE